MVMSSRYRVTLFSPAAEVASKIQELLLHVVHREHSKAEKIVRNNPDWIQHKGRVTDSSNRTFNNISAFQYALWALDTNYQLPIMLDCIPDGRQGDEIRKALLKQYNDMQGDDLLKIAFNTLLVPFSQLAEMLPNSEGIIFFDNKIYFADKTTQSVVLIAAEVTTQLAELKSLFAGMANNSTRQSNTSEHQLIYELTGHLLKRTGVQYEDNNGARHCSAHHETPESKHLHDRLLSELQLSSAARPT